MLRQRLLVSAILIPLAVIVIHLGGYIYQITIIVLLMIAAWEYTRLLNRMDLEPAVPLVFLGVLALAVTRSLVQFNFNSVILMLLIFGSAAYHIYRFEKNKGKPAADFGATLSVIMYIGFLGSYLISLRSLPNGIWWTFLVLPTVWIADSGAYLVGSAIGKNKFSPRTSPNKTWEGYLGGILFGILGGIGLTLLYNNVFNAGLIITPLEGALLALVLSILIPLGDLTESLIKRQASVKDSGNIFPGHGGVFDRIDVLLWAGPLGYYLVLHAFLL
jgi:phosphatidate cytidylyltransferase